MSYVTDLSSKTLGLVLAVGAALTIQGTMLWGFDGVAAQAAASCAADNTKTATSQPATLKSAHPNPGGMATKALAPA